ncbi:MAG: hypothetical protein JSR82_07980 [Verrucomicrobia bacterium]|nr:hypothetical protein [Verrucomicrobiota bacterium]
MSTPPVERRFERAFFVFGLRRGGNHALAEWLKGHFAADEVLHLNNARLAAFDVREAAIRFDDGEHAAVTPTAAQRILLVGYENVDFLRFPAAQNFQIARRCDWLVLLRDLPNMAASICRSARERPDFVWRHRLRDFPELWSMYARRFLAAAGGARYVSFNRWFAEEAYRRELAAALKLEFTDRGLNAISAVGGGSSFDGLAFDGRAQAMPVLERWPEYLDDSLFRCLVLAERESLARNAELFGNFPYSFDELLARGR